MQRQGLVSGHYDHGLQITDKARKRLELAKLDTVTIPSPKRWDKRWRIIFYDIPESNKAGRDKLAHKLRRLGCQQLQRSVWIYPFPCENEVNTVSVAFGVEKYVTYLESVRIANKKALLNRFSHLL